jgi:rhamnose utilization protein RhaD (predicted bifunctional aldolase and dehydrogenase)
MSEANFIGQLVALARALGNPDKDYTILGEGNVSGKEVRESFWVKASGTSLGTLTENELIQVYFDPIHELLVKDQLSDKAIKNGLQAAKVDPNIVSMPSVETFLHAILLQLKEINFIGHTHPTAVNSILCSVNAEEAFSGSLFPDQIVYCGPMPLYIPYTDPGLPLAQKIRREINAYFSEWGLPPKIILMQNHGLIALGKTAAEVEQITAMSVKAANVILGAYAMGGPHFLSKENVDRIYTRPDELYRKEMWESK